MIEKKMKNYIGEIEMIINNFNVCEIIISITPEKQGMHYGKESMKALMEYAYKTFGIKEFELYVQKNKE